MGFYSIAKAKIRLRSSTKISLAKSLKNKEKKSITSYYGHAKIFKGLLQDLSMRYADNDRIILDLLNMHHKLYRRKYDKIKRQNKKLKEQNDLLLYQQT